MRVKITQPGWQAYDGPLFGVQFEGGVSQGDLKPEEAAQLGAMVSVVEIDDEGEEVTTINPAADIIRYANVAAPDVNKNRMRSEADIAAEKAAVEAVAGDVDADIANAAPVVRVYTQDELEAIATQHGIGGLREIGDRLGVKNTSIKGLIREILAAQDKAGN